VHENVGDPTAPEHESSAPFRRRLRSEAAARRVLDAVAGRIDRVRVGSATLEIPPTARIGILLQWGIGDAVLNLPLLTGLRQALPGARIELIGKPWLESLFAGTGLSDASHVLVPPWTRHTGKYRPGSGAWRRYLNELRLVRRTRFDLVVSCRFDARDIMQLRLLRSDCRAGFGSAGGAGWLDLDLGPVPSRESGLPVHRDAAEALNRLTGTVAPPVPVFPDDPAAAQRALQRLRQAGFQQGPLVALSVSAGNPIRRWDPDRFTEVLMRVAPKIGFLVIIRDPADPVDDGVRVPVGLPSVEWSGSLAELRALLSVTDLTLCSDSGVMHVASATGNRVVAVFGPGSLQWYRPYGEEDRVVIHEPMPCRPCFDQCIYDQPLCMNAVTVDMVEEAMSAALDGELVRRDREL
jgi:heptosyltransferase II